MLENGQAVPIEQLVRLTQNGCWARMTDTARLHYAEAMALTVYLMEGRGGKYRDGYLDYLQRRPTAGGSRTTAATSSTTASAFSYRGARRRAPCRPEGAGGRERIALEP